MMRGASVRLAITLLALTTGVSAGCAPFVIQVSQQVVSSDTDSATVEVRVENMANDAQRNLLLLTALNPDLTSPPELTVIPRLEARESAEFFYRIPNRPGLYAPARVLGSGGKAANSSQLRLGQASAGLTLTEGSEVLIYPTGWEFPLTTIILQDAIQVEHLEVTASTLTTGRCISVPALLDFHSNTRWNDPNLTEVRHSAFWHRPSSQQLALRVGRSSELDGSETLPVAGYPPLDDASVVVTGWRFAWEPDGVDRDIGSIGLQIEDVLVDTETGVVEWTTVPTFANDAGDPFSWEYSYAVIGVYGDAQFFPMTHSDVAAAGEGGVTVVEPFTFSGSNYENLALFVRGWRMSFSGEDKRLRKIGVNSSIASRQGATGDFSSEVYFHGSDRPPFEYEIEYVILAFDDDVAGHAQLNRRAMPMFGHLTQSMDYCLSRLLQ